MEIGRGFQKDRPVVFNYRSISAFIGDMIEFRKKTDSTFSVRKSTSVMPGCSPSLVTQLVKGKRRLTRDRVEMLSQLLGLNRKETQYLDQWVANERVPSKNKSRPEFSMSQSKKRNPQNHLLSNWLNIYVKDASSLKSFQLDPKVIFRILGGIASVKQIEKSIHFLIKEGFLRRTLDGKIVKNDALTITSNDIPNKKIRQFHKRALAIAARGLEVYPIEQRRANAIVMALNQSSVEELRDILNEFYEKLNNFAEEHSNENERLYQVLINLTPIGGQ